MFVSLKKLRNDNSGVIMVTVLVMVLIMTVVAIGILGVNISQVSTSESVVDSIRAEQLAIGAFYQYHQRQIEGVGNALNPEIIDNKTYTISMNITAGAGLNGTDKVEVKVDYP